MTNKERQRIREQMCDGILHGTLAVHKKTVDDKEYYQIVDSGYTNPECDEGFEIIREFFNIEPEQSLQWEEMLAIYTDEILLTEDLMSAKTHAQQVVESRRS